jgi:colicin import membrane protein
VLQQAAIEAAQPDVQHSSPSAAAQGRKQPSKSSKQPKIQQLFQQPLTTTAQQGTRARRVSPQQPAVLPADAQVDPARVLAANKAAAAAAKAQAQLQRLDPQLAAGFQAFRQSFQDFVGEPAASKPTADHQTEDSTETPAGAKAAAAAAAAKAQAKARAAAAARATGTGSAQQQAPEQKQQQQLQHEDGGSQARRGPSGRSRRDFLELFGMPLPQQQQQAPQVRVG